MEKGTFLVGGDGKEQKGEICKIHLRSVESAGRWNLRSDSGGLQGIVLGRWGQWKCP